MPSSPAWTPATLLKTRALRLLLLLTCRSVAAQCSINASCVVARRGKGQCAPVTPHCTRPCGAYHVHMRGTGGKWVGEQLLNHLYYREETAFVIEGSSLRSAKATREAYACARLGDCLHLTILRHPVDRVISRYWFEGRWGLFKKPVKDEEISFSDWLRQKRQIHAGHRNERLWSVTSELYTKTLAGVVVDKHLQLSFVHLETAKEWLDAAFPLITEWLSTPHTARALGRRLCFATDGSGKPPIHVPKRRAAGGHTARRPASWLPSMEDLELLWNDNAHDLQLYDYATKLVGERFADASLGPLPPTPPTASASEYRAWLAARIT